MPRFNAVLRYGTPAPKLSEFINKDSRERLELRTAEGHTQCCERSRFFPPKNLPPIKKSKLNHVMPVLIVNAFE